MVAFVVIGAVGIAFFFRRMCFRFDSVYYGESCGFLKPPNPKQQARNDSTVQQADTSGLYESFLNPPAPAPAEENPVRSDRV
jgi:hypothetical protein